MAPSHSVGGASASTGTLRVPYWARRCCEQPADKTVGIPSWFWKMFNVGLEGRTRPFRMSTRERFENVRVLQRRAARSFHGGEVATTVLLVQTLRCSAARFPCFLGGIDRGRSGNVATKRSLL